MKLDRSLPETNPPEQVQDRGRRKLIVFDALSLIRTAYSMGLGSALRRTQRSDTEEL